MNKKTSPKLSDDNLTIEFDAKDFKKSLPHLSSELMGGEKTINIQGIQNIVPDPGAIDFIRRCSTKEEAFEIIEFLLNRNEISLDEFQSLKDQIKNQGLSSFGPQKKKGYYEKKFRRNNIIQ
ncbi:DUF2095 family protein [Promethearchaeum syntrophicum]|uniref:DUF2095 family protein n=1 Tax=Promethearchaeum syntrophicum TaxID=2594042 RepID=A0A5B9D818_9ARCH|nr:DUF2095 family protein [Candidatus Prometheoarchaeum syntrophicum]QEE14890.1 hypothetical protein DSAG12_00711 [Candidatus Prometheoarchaeum syntrophicum]